MKARLNQNPGKDRRAATNSRCSTVVALQQPAQAGYRNYVFRQITVFPLPASRFLERHITYLEILHLLGQLTIGSSGKHYQKRLHQCPHPAVLHKSKAANGMTSYFHPARLPNQQTNRDQNQQVQPANLEQGNGPLSYSLLNSKPLRREKSRHFLSTRVERGFSWLNSLS